MSDQLPSHDSLPQSLTEFNPSQDNLDNQDEGENLQDSLSKSGFKRRAIIHQSSDALSDIEKNGVTWLPDTSEPLTFKESTQSEFMVSNSPEKGSFSGMGFQPAEYSSLQTLKCIINEAKQAERYMFSGEEHHYEVDNYMKVHFSDENEVREYFLEDDVTFDRMPTSIKKTENQGLVIDFTGESIQKENEELKTSTLTNEALGHSKSSYISGSVRYSKMPEEEAASIFEQRRKELLDSLAKKGKRKNLRIFQDTDQNTARLPTGADNQMSSPKEKSTVPGFVIFNTGKSNASQLRGAESPLSAKKDRQKDSMLRKSLTSARSPKTHTQAAVSMSQSREKKEFTSPREYSSPVSITRENTVKTKPVEKREVQKKDPVSSPIIKTVVKDIKNPKREELSPTKICVDAKILKHTSSSTKNIKNSARDTAMTEEDRKVRRETLSKINESEYDREIKSADIVPKQQVKGKNKEIWADIEELDQQIQQLEESKVSLDKQREQVNSSITFSEQGSRLDNKSMFKRKTKEDITERMPVLYRNERLPSENESPGKGISSDRYKLDSEDFLIETETDNVYKRYLSERSQAESPVINYRKSPNQDESSLNLYSQSYRSQNDRRLSNPGEYLYQRALEKKENRQQQIEKRQKEKEIMELSACTFTPNLRPLDTSEDFETRSRNWQNQKEKRLDEIQKYNMEKEMAECTFYPSTSRKTGPVKPDPNDFYNRNIEWKKKVETEDVEKHNEPVRTTTMSSENKSQSNVSYSSKPSYSNVPSISKAVEPQNANKGYVKLQLGNKKPNEEPVKVFTLTNDTHRSKMKPVEVQSQHLGTLEDEFSYRRRSDQIKRPTLENFVSTELKDLLKRGANYKSDKIETAKSKGTSPNKTPKDLQLNTSKSREMQPNHPVILTTLRDSFPSKKSPTSQNGTPLGFTDNFSKSVKNSMEGTQAKGNKYYLSRKPKQIESATVPTHQDTYSSMDKKDPVMSAGYSNQSRKQSSNKVMAPGAYQLIQGSKVDQENKHFKKKPLSKGQTTSYASGELSEDQLFFYPEESRIPLATRQANNNDMANSPHDYIRRNTSKEIANNFEKDFLEFVSMAGKERQPSDKNVSPDGDLSKKRRTNLSLQ